ncbi:MAG TPA: efflux transporter outer membrane subunit [Gammaproteobacteria bacterium]|nr:efflux transporter outer membrane subunit [Gammaproteobacteria bacterium]
MNAPRPPRRSLVLAGLALALSACSLAPPLEVPEVAMPAVYKEALPPLEGQWKEATPADGEARGAWWSVFGDPVLSALVVEAGSANQNLAAAAARVEQSRALVQTARAARLPRVDAGFGAARTQPTNVIPGLPGGSDVPPYDLFQFDVAASYEIDLFGRVRDSVRASQADLAAERALFESLKLSLQADVARLYFLLRQTDAEIEVVQEAIRWRRETLRILERRLAAGDIGELDVVRARSELENARTDALTLERARAQYEHALAILLGRAPAAFALARAELAASPPAIPAGLPSALLERRPDVAAAERRLASANARIGVAKAAFYPLLNLTADAGVAASDIGDLFKWSARTWTLGPLAATLVTLPIFDGGRNRANLERAEAVLAEDAASYRQTVLAAVGEVEDALVGLRTLAQQTQTVRVSQESSARAVAIAQRRYDAGATGYLDVIDAQREALSVDRLREQITGARLVTAVALIRALGGGW